MRLFPAFILVTPAAQAQVVSRTLTPSGSPRRLALVIGNNAYPWGTLANAVNDARSIATVLPELGFVRSDITLLTDTPIAAMRRGVTSFLDRLRSGDMAFVFYSGHGVEVGGQNYLLPVDFPRDTTEFEVADYAYSAQRILEGPQQRNAGVRILILDACRDNPLRTARSGAGGLARMEGRGTLVVFATEAGRTASDNRNAPNGLLTLHLLEGLRQPGIVADTMFKQVARAVDNASAGKQTPQVYGLLLQDFVFRAGVPLDEESEFWNECKARGGASCQAYQDQYPQGRFVRLARARLTP